MADSQPHLVYRLSWIQLCINEFWIHKMRYFLLFDYQPKFPTFEFILVQVVVQSWYMPFVLSDSSHGNGLSQVWGNQYANILHTLCLSSYVYYHHGYFNLPNDPRHHWFMFSTTWHLVFRQILPCHEFLPTITAAYHSYKGSSHSSILTAH